MIRLTKERLVYSDPTNPWLRLYFDNVEFADGRPGRYNRIVEGDGGLGVAVLPISNAGVGLVHPFRYAVGERLWEIPRGYVDDPKGDPATDAARELHEETGLKANRLVPLGSIFPNGGLLSTRVFLFAAHCAAERAVPELENGETLPFRWVASNEILAAAAGGEIDDAITLATILRASVRGLLDAPA